MRFEDHYIERVNILLREQDSKFDLALKQLLQNAAKDHELGGGNTIRKIMACCSSQTEDAINLLVEIAAEMIEVSEKNVSRKKIWNLIEQNIDSLIENSEEKKLKAMKTAQGPNLHQNIIEASSLDDKYRLYKSEAGFTLDKALADLRKKRGKTLKDRILYRLNNNLLYIIVVFLLAAIAWIYKD